MNILPLPSEKLKKKVENKFVRKLKRYTFATAIEKYN
jgi:hypothetical protein